MRSSWVGWLPALLTIAAACGGRYDSTGEREASRGGSSGGASADEASSDACVWAELSRLECARDQSCHQPAKCEYSNPTLPDGVDVLAQFCTSGYDVIVRTEGDCEQPVSYLLEDVYDEASGRFSFVLSRARLIPGQPKPELEYVQSITWKAPEDGQPRYFANPVGLSVSPEETKALFSVGDESFREIFLELELASGTVRTIQGFSGYTAFAWLDDDRFVFDAVLSDTEGDDEGLYLVDTRESELKPIYVAGGYERGAALGTIDGEFVITGGVRAKGQVGPERAFTVVPIGALEQVVEGTRPTIDVFNDSDVQVISRSLWADVQGYWLDGRWLVTASDAYQTQYRIEKVTVSDGRVSIGEERVLLSDNPSLASVHYAGNDLFLLNTGAPVVISATQLFDAEPTPIACPWREFDGVACDATTCGEQTLCANERCIAACDGSLESVLRPLAEGVELLYQWCTSAQYSAPEGACQTPVQYFANVTQDGEELRVEVGREEFAPRPNAFSGELITFSTSPLPAGGPWFGTQLLELNPSKTKALLSLQDVSDPPKGMTIELDLQNGEMRWLDGARPDYVAWIDDERWVQQTARLSVVPDDEGLFFVDGSGPDLVSTKVAHGYEPRGALGIVGNEYILVGGARAGGPVDGAPPYEFVGLPLSAIVDVVAGDRPMIEVFDDSDLGRVGREDWYALQGYVIDGRWLVSATNEGRSAWGIESLTPGESGVAFGPSKPLFADAGELTGVFYAGEDRLLIGLPGGLQMITIP